MILKFKAIDDDGNLFEREFDSIKDLIKEYWKCMSMETYSSIPKGDSKIIEYELMGLDMDPDMENLTFNDLMVQAQIAYWCD